MNAATRNDKRALVRHYYPAIDRDIRGARNLAIGAARSAASHFKRAREVLDDYRHGWLGSRTSANDADRLASEYFRLGLDALALAALDRREMKRLIRFRRTAIP